MTNNLVVRLARRLELWTYRNAEIVNAVTDGIRDILVTVKGVDSHKVMFLPNGVDIDLFSPWRPDLELQHRFNWEDRATFLYAGTHGYAQGLEVMMQAVLQPPNQAVIFIFVGDGPAKAQLIWMEEEHRLSNVVFADAASLTKMPAYYSIVTAATVTLRDISLFRMARPTNMLPTLPLGFL